MGASDWVPSYGSIHALGHKQVLDILTGHVTVEEKIDGSQFSFGVYNGELRMRSKGAIVNQGDGNKMFSNAVASIQSRVHLLHPDWTYRGEYLQKPKHNALAYDRVPMGHVMVFDIMTETPEDYLDYEAKVAECETIDLECVPLLYAGLGVVLTLPTLKEWLERTSILGGQKVEGVVIKNYSSFTADHHVLMAKYVSEAFKEVHAESWRASNPTRGDVIATLIARLRTDARWNKGIIHLREQGLYDGSPRDIGPLLKEVAEDVRTEEEERIKDALFHHFWPQIQRGVTAGLPEWYKERLAKDAFDATAN